MLLMYNVVKVEHMGKIVDRSRAIRKAMQTDGRIARLRSHLVQSLLEDRPSEREVEMSIILGVGPPERIPGEEEDVCVSDFALLKFSSCYVLLHFDFLVEILRAADSHVQTIDALPWKRLVVAQETRSGQSLIIGDGEGSA